MEYDTMVHDQAIEKQRMLYWKRGQVWAGSLSAVAVGGSVLSLFFGAPGWAVIVISAEFVTLVGLFLLKQGKKV